jgi:plastocyanin
MKKFKLLLPVLLFVMGIYLVAPQAVIASDDIRIIRLKLNVAAGTSYQIPFLIEPETLSVRKGTIVVFANDGIHEVGVIFEEGKTCQSVTKAAEGFKLDAATACYKAVVMANGGTESLRFMEPGVYEYKVTWGDRPQASRGKIVVY